MVLAKSEQTGRALVCACEQVLLFLLELLSVGRDLLECILVVSSLRRKRGTAGPRCFPTLRAHKPPSATLHNARALSATRGAELVTGVAEVRHRSCFTGYLIRR